MKERLRQHLRSALEACFSRGTLTSGSVPEIQLEVPGNPDHGDFATNLAMMLAKAERKAALLNWQLTVQSPEFRSEIEQLLTQLPLGGGLFLALAQNSLIYHPAQNRAAECQPVQQKDDSPITVVGIEDIY